VEKSILNQFRLTVSEKELKVHGIAVYRRGKPILTHRWIDDFRQNLWSCTKGYTGIAIGICQDEGRLKVTDKILDIFPEYRSVASDKTEQITIRDILHMASGKDFTNERIQIHEMTEGDCLDYFMRAPVIADIGKTYYYTNSCSYALSRIVEKVSGKSLRDFLADRMFSVMGIANVQWDTCNNRHTLGGMGLYLRTEELLKFGIMLQDGGVWEGKRIVSEEYIKQALTDTVITKPYMPTSDEEQQTPYGYHMWTCTREGVYRIDGLYGQMMVVFPQKDVVVALNSFKQDGNGFHTLRAVYEMVDLIEPNSASN